MVRIVFLKVAWMSRYQGLSGDKIISEDRFVKKMGYGHEIFNNLAWNRRMYGYVQANDRMTIAIERLGASKEDESISNVLVVWVATRPFGGVFVVGWYKNATVYRKWQRAPKGSNRKYKGEMFGYNVTTVQQACTILPFDKRVIKIPKGTMRMAHVWYAEGTKHDGFRNRVTSFINNGGIPPRPRPRPGKRKQVDPYLRTQIEKSAITAVTRHYEILGYTVESFEKDNLGWDLEACHEHADVLLRVEVKGLSQSNICVDLTPNEYAMMQEYRDSYRVAVLTNALTRRRKLAIFSFSPESKQWEDDDGCQLIINKAIGARLTAQ